MNCLTGDPLFVDPVNFSFETRANSPAIDAGLTHPVYATFQSLYGIPLTIDLKGTPRPAGAAFDIGALESVAAAPAAPKNLRIIP